MATPFEDLEVEVRKLRREVRRLKGNQPTNAQQVQELVGVSSRADHLSGFSAACADSRANANAELRDKAVRFLNSSQPLSRFEEGSFRQAYGSVSDIDVLLAEHRAGNKVR